MSASDYVCEFDGCERGPGNGHALHRTSPKGGPFKGRCDMHMGEPVDPGVALITGAIQEDNRRRKANDS